jgi:hypothetical protein
MSLSLEASGRGGGLHKVQKWWTTKEREEGDEEKKVFKNKNMCCNRFFMTFRTKRHIFKLNFILFN